MTEIRTLFKQSSHYFAGRIIIMAAGFISFPILTRIFSVSEYGLLGLITTTIFVTLAIGKLGFPASIVRFYSEFESKKQLNNFCSTIFLGSVAVATITSVLIMLFSRVMNNYIEGNDIANLLSLASILILTGGIIDTLTSFMRAEQRTRLYNFIIVIQRYGSLTLSIFLVFYFIKGLYGFLVGQIVVALIIISFLVYLLYQEKKIAVSNFSISIFWTSIKFGFPLACSELGYLGLNYIDRYFIQYYLGSISLGLYTAGYNLATYVAEIFMYSVDYAMTPIYMRMLVNKGEEETKQFFTKTLRYFILIVAPVAFGFMGVSGDLLAFLASRRYIGANIILPYIIIGQIIHSVGNMLNAGLFIKRRTNLITIIVIGSCILNIGLNIALIPHFGIIGAAIATLIAYTFYATVITYYAFREFSFRIDYSHILLYILIAGSMYLLIRLINGGSVLSNLMIKIPVGAIFYATFVLILDFDVRCALFERIKNSCMKKEGVRYH